MIKLDENLAIAISFTILIIFAIKFLLPQILAQFSSRTQLIKSNFDKASSLKEEALNYLTLAHKKEESLKKEIRKINEQAEKTIDYLNDISQKNIENLFKKKNIILNDKIERYRREILSSINQEIVINSFSVLEDIVENSPNSDFLNIYNKTSIEEIESQFNISQKLEHQ